MYVLMRMDDNGNEFEVKRSSKRGRLEKLRKEYEDRGHRQIYWIRRVRNTPPKTT